MTRLRASAALVLTAFFAVAGAFHQHAVPKPTHDHAGFCSATATIGLETCAICKVAQTASRLPAEAVAPFTIDRASRLALAARCVRPSAGCPRSGNPRAPPTV